MSHPQHEDLCRRCGISCHFAVPVNGTPVVIDELHCKYLEQKEPFRFHCSVYEKRYEVAPWCHSAIDAREHGFLAQDCPYARDIPNYRGKVRLGKGLTNLVLPAVRAEIIRLGVPIGACPDSALRLLHQDPTLGRFCYTESPDGTRYLFEQVVPPASTEPAK